MPTPPETTCLKCGARAAENVCHVCKTPRPGFEQPAPAEACTDPADYATIKTPNWRI